ncbi:MAG: hypothetical protein JEZ03_01620 [Bacteroidales bacterium]|nr:hypothetical protein [Bacteroidales bacterium]
MTNPRTYADIMAQIHTAFWNAEDPLILNKLIPIGITMDWINAGKLLYAEVTNLNQTQNKEYADVDQANADYNELRLQMEKSIKRLVKIVKHKFEEDIQIISNLNLNKPFPRRRNDFYEFSVLLIENILANESIITAITPYGYSNEFLTGMQTDLMNQKTLQDNRDKEQGEAQQATKDRDAKLDQLREMYEELIIQAKLVFEYENPQYLEKLGILVRS